jgi:N-acetylglutamate synthase-like GNAT family acetyltransferase
LNTQITVSTDSNKLNIEFIHAFITQTYWAKGRTLEEMQICINNSLNFGVFLNDEQIGYERIVTDYVQFAYLMDVFIIEAHRGNAYSKVLMSFIMNDIQLSKVRVWRLATTDASSLYKQFGFTPLENPEKMMELKK